MALLTRKSSFFLSREEEIISAEPSEGSELSAGDIEEVTQVETEIQNDVQSLEENNEVINALEAQGEEITDVVESTPEAITEQVVQEHNNRFILCLGRLGAGTDVLSKINVGFESSSTPIERLQVTKEEIGKSIKEFFQKVWNWIKSIFNKIVEWFKKLFGVTKKKEETIAKPVQIDKEVKTEEVDKALKVAVEIVEEEEKKEEPVLLLTYQPSPETSEKIKEFIETKVINNSQPKISKQEIEKAKGDLRKEKKAKEEKLYNFIISFLKTRVDTVTPLLFNKIYGNKVDYNDLEKFATNISSIVNQLLKTPGDFTTMVSRVKIQSSKFNKTLADIVLKRGGWNGDTKSISIVNIPVGGVDNGKKDFTSVEFIPWTNFSGSSENLGLPPYSVFKKEETTKHLVNFYKYSNFAQAQSYARGGGWSKFIDKTRSTLDNLQKELEKIIKDYEEGKIDLSKDEPNEELRDAVVKNRLAYFRKVQSVIPYGLKQVNFTAKLVNNMVNDWYAYRQSLAKVEE